MKLQIIVHQAEEGGYWAEVPLRIKGSDHIYGKPDIAQKISVPIHDNKDINPVITYLSKRLVQTAFQP